MGRIVGRAKRQSTLKASKREGPAPLKRAKTPEKKKEREKERKKPESGTCAVVGCEVESNLIAYDYPFRVFYCEAHRTQHHPCCEEDCKEWGTNICRYCVDLTHEAPEYRCDEHMAKHVTNIYRGPKCHVTDCGEWAACRTYIMWRMENLHDHRLLDPSSLISNYIYQKFVRLMDGCHAHHGYHCLPYETRLRLEWDPANIDDILQPKIDD